MSRWVWLSQGYVASTHLLFLSMFIRSHHFYRVTAVGKARILMLANKRFKNIYNYTLAILSVCLSLSFANVQCFPRMCVCVNGRVCVCVWDICYCANELIEYLLCDRLCAVFEAFGCCIICSGIAGNSLFSILLWVLTGTSVCEVLPLSPFTVL